MKHVKKRGSVEYGLDPKLPSGGCPQVVIGMDVASSEFRTKDNKYDLDFKVGRDNWHHSFVYSNSRAMSRYQLVCAHRD